MKKIYAFLPCYNEEKNIGALIEQWLEQADALADAGYELCVLGIDDKSTDRTADVIKRYAQTNPAVRLIRHKKNKNLGGGLSTAFTIFTRECDYGDLCVLMDGDNTHSPRYVISMIDKIKEGADCVIASRYCGNSEVVGVPKIRVFLSDAARVFYSLVLGVKNVKDYTCGYRVYTYEIIESAEQTYGKRFVEMKTFSCMMEVLYKLSRIGAKFAEVPFTLRYDNKQGETKMKIFKTASDSIITALKLRFS